MVTTWRSYQAAARAEHEHEQATHTCPTCGNVIGGELQDHRSFSCSQCRGRFRVAVDPQTQRLALFEQVDGDIAEPLNMPKGSIRALVTIAMAVSCWILMFTADDVPSYLLSVLLATVGYYFGFRMKAKAEASRIYDPHAKVRDPLLLPSGWIRGFLTLGFVIGGLVLYARGKANDHKYAEFFVVLAGLVAGHYFTRGLERIGSHRLNAVLNHVKGLVVLAATGYLCVLLLSGAHLTAPVAVRMALACTITFYFGSRS